MQRKDRQHSERDTDGQSIMLGFWEKQKEGYRNCYFRCRQGWILDTLYPHGGRCRHRRFGLALPCLLPAVFYNEGVEAYESFIWLQVP